jgi:hypothetical protein
MAHAAMPPLIRTSLVLLLTGIAVASAANPIEACSGKMDRDKVRILLQISIL